MTTRQYVLKYKLNESNKFNHSDFVEDLASDFIALLEINKANDNIKGFDNALRCIRMKFDAISNKTNGIMPEKLWGYFYASVIVKLREQFCPRDMQKRREQQEQREKAWKQRKAQRDWENEQYEDFFWSQNFLSFLFAKRDVKPVDCFTVLGLSDNANVLEVKTAYKKLSIIHHPDKGGKQDKFIEITEAKNKCLSWLDTQ